MRSNYVFLAVSTLAVVVAAGTTPPHHGGTSPPNADTIGASAISIQRIQIVVPSVRRSDVTGLVRISVGWLEKLQNRTRFVALIRGVSMKRYMRSIDRRTNILVLTKTSNSSNIGLLKGGFDCIDMRRGSC